MKRGAPKGRVALTPLLALATSCGIFGPRLRPEAEVRPHVVATLTFPSLGRLQERLDVMTKRWGSPRVDVYGTVVGLLGGPARWHRGIDFDKPIALALVETRGADDLPPIAVALAVHAHPGKEEEVVDGIKDARRGGLGAGLRTFSAAALQDAGRGSAGGVPSALARTLGPGSSIGRASFVGVEVRGSSVVLADTDELLVASGAAARAAQRPEEEDVLLRVHPEAWTRAAGATPKALLAEIARSWAAGAAEARGRAGLLRAPGAAALLVQLVEGGLAARWEALTHADAIEAALSFDPNHGLMARLAITPRPGSALATSAAALRPMAFDPRWLASGSPAALAAYHCDLWSDPPRRRHAEIWRATGQGGGAELGAALAAERAALEGPCFAAVHLQEGVMGWDEVRPLRAGADAAALLAAEAAALQAGAPQKVAALLDGAPLQGLEVTRTGDTVRSVEVLDVGPSAPPAALAEATLRGGARVPTLVSVRRNALVASTGRGAEVRLGRLTVGRAPALSEPIAAALARAAGSAGFVYADALALGMAHLSAARAQGGSTGPATLVAAIPGLAQQRLPVLLTYRGGAQLTAQIFLAMADADRVMGFMRPLWGAGGSGPPP